MNIAILCSGGGTNLQAIIDAAKKGYIPARIALVVSDNKDAFALKRAKDAGIETLVLNAKDFKTREAFDKEIVKNLERRNIELVVLAGFMRLLSPYFVSQFPNRILNIHPALLPAFPGLEAQRQALEHGVKFTGCSVHFVDENLDAGPIILQAAVPVLDDDTVETLSARILKEEHRIYSEAITIVLSGRWRLEGRRMIRTGAPPQAP